ncbi:MAG: ROK family protein [Candidatus Atribacteria bacterium]|nr:ROK family protein [Candidatus Atribacteria bacterium]
MNKKIVYSAAIDIGQTSTKFSLISNQGSIKYFFDMSSEKFFIHLDPFAFLVNQIKSLINNVQSQGLEVSAIGVSSTMDVNAVDGTLRFVNTEQFNKWKIFSLKEFFQNQFRLPIVIENDGIAAAWGEFCVGSGKETRNFINIMIGTGIGGGVILDGNILPDSLGSGSYFGHMSININGDECPLCNHKGCWEMYASGYALEKQAEKILSSTKQDTVLSIKPSVREIIEAAQTGDNLAILLLNDLGYYLGFGLVNLVNIFNPELIILGGGLIHADKFFTKQAIEILNEKRMPLRNKIRVVISKLGAQAALIGVGLMAINECEKDKQ